ncbi:MAG TPA: tRNA (guanosine(37)-N1)-methyltransferase TrmD [Candidatus Paceibacterota bacterium]
MTYHIVTLFPTTFDSYLSESILKRAIEDKKIAVKFYNPRDFLPKKKNMSYADRRVDDKPYGGGPGMVIEALPVIKAIEVALKKCKVKSVKSKVKILWFSPSGKQFDTVYAKKVVEKFDHLILVCGRYEGIDARVKKAFKMEEISVGPFVLTGGELPAQILIDCISRQVEGVLGNFNSREEERVTSSDVYTRPEVVEYKGKKLRVPKVLLSGHRAKIEEWKKSQRT